MQSVATLSMSFVLFAGACVTGTEPVDYTVDASAVNPSDASDTTSITRDGALDAVVADAGSESDAGDVWRRPHVVFPASGSTASLRLSELGLYRDMASKQLAPDLIAYVPRYALWSDGARKLRWLYLPQGASIDTTDPDHWLFPEGAVFFKEFASEDGKRLETRVLARTGPLANDVFFGSFLWLDDESDAVFVPAGVANVRGTQHDVPTQDNCGTCHRGEPGRVLGFSAVQRPSVTPSSFVVPGAAYEIPGAPPTREALGYLHANCAHCHNEDGSARRQTRLTLRLSVHDVTKGQTTIERNTVGVTTDNFLSDTTGAQGQRVQAGNTEDSIILQRMKVRGATSQMPYLGTERVDEDGVRLIERWVSSLTRPDTSTVDATPSVGSAR